MVEFICRIMQSLPVRDRFAKPLAILSSAFIAMISYHINVLKPVIGHFERGYGITIKTGGLFHIIICSIRLPSFGDQSLKVIGSPNGWQICKGLQVTFANACGCISTCSQQVDKGICAFLQSTTIVTQPVNRRHTTSHQRSTIGHTHGQCDMKVFKQSTLSSDFVDIRSTNDRMACAAKPISTMLISNEKQKVRFSSHIILILVVAP